MSGWEAARFIANDSVVEIMGLIMVAALTLFLADPLQRPNLTFADRHYMVATALIPLQITSFFQNEKKIGCIQPLTERFGDLILSAISSSSSSTTTTTMTETDSDQNLANQLGEDRSFPISLVFHTFVTLCCWFMNYQMQRRNDAVKQVMDMKKILQNAERQAATKTTTAASSSGGVITNNKKKTKK